MRTILRMHLTVIGFDILPYRERTAACVRSCICISLLAVSPRSVTRPLERACVAGDLLAACEDSLAAAEVGSFYAEHE